MHGGGCIHIVVSTVGADGTPAGCGDRGVFSLPGHTAVSLPALGLCLSKSDLAIKGQ